MAHRVIILLLVAGLIGCSQQSELSHKTTAVNSGYSADSKIGKVRIMPETPSATTPLEAEVFLRGYEPEHVSYQWFRNETAIPGASRPLLSDAHLQKGDFVEVEVRASYPGSRIDRSVSEVVVIGNTPPLIGRVSIGPNPADSRNTLQATVHTTDRDGDQVSVVYEWTVDDETIIGQTTPSLPSSYFGRGSEVQVTATPFDGSDAGDSRRSNVLVILNGAPTIVSDPPVGAQANMYRYVVQAEDPDGDPLLFSLGGQPPAGMEIDSATGVVLWQVVVPQKEVTYNYEVVAEDPEGAKSIQKITMHAGPSGGQPS
jgi:hypothetical protein